MTINWITFRKSSPFITTKTAYYLPSQWRFKNQKVSRCYQTYHQRTSCNAHMDHDQMVPYPRWVGTWCTWLDKEYLCLGRVLCIWNNQGTSRNNLRKDKEIFSSDLSNFRRENAQKVIEPGEKKAKAVSASCILIGSKNKTRNNVETDFVAFSSLKQWE